MVIDDEILKEAMKVANLKTKREAIEAGLRELIRKKNIEAFRQKLGTFDLDLALEELEILRSES